MRNIGILTGFFPMIIYGILSGNTTIALLAATIVAVLVGFDRLKRGFYLDWANVLMFAGGLIGYSVLNIQAIAGAMHMVIYFVLMIVAFGSLLMGSPFTLQYAKDMVDKSRWETPAFKSVNRFMTGVWGAVFLINFLLLVYAAMGSGSFAQIAGQLVWVFLILGIIFTIAYPEYLRKKLPFGAP
jgi:hypothetical protein